MRRISSTLGLTAFALIAGQVAYAQNPTTGMITGIVKDSNGNPIAGAVVSVTGQSLQGARTVTSAADGRYRLPFIPTGSGYKMTVTKSGFAAPQVRNLSVDPWQTVNQDLVLKVVSLGSETVEVVASSNAVDKTSVTSAKTFSNDTLSTIPLFSRDVSAAAYLTPGVADGGRGQENPNIGGGTAFENNYIIDGLNVTDPVYGENRSKVNTLAVESVQVITGGFEPEYGRTTGGIISVVTKSGSNDFHADMEVTTKPSGAAALPSAQAELPFSSARNVDGTENTVAFWLGGPVVKDRLWYSLGVSRDSKTTTRSYNPIYFLDPEQATNNPLAKIANVPGHTNVGTSYDLPDNTLSVQGKFTYSVNADHSVELSFNRNRSTTDSNLLAQTFTDLQSKYKFKEDVDSLSLNWKAVLSPSWFLDLRAGTYKKHDYDSDTPTAYDQMRVSVGLPAAYLSGQTQGGTYAYNSGARAYPGMTLGGQGVVADNEAKRSALTIKGSNYIGNHQIKYGIDWEQNTYKSFFRYGGDALVTRDINVDTVTGKFISFRDTYRFRTGANGVNITAPTGKLTGPLTTVEGVLTGGKGLTLDSKTQNQALFLQDQWQITPKVMLLYGVRMDNQKLYGGDGAQYLEFKGSDMTAPRFGLTWDVNGDGKDVWKLNFGQFFEAVPMDLNQRAGSVEGFAQFRRTVTDVTKIFTVPTFNDVLDVTAGKNRSDAYHYRTIGGAKAELDPTIKPQSISEVGLSFDKRLTDLWTLGFNFKFRWYNKVIEDFSFDFGNSYVIGNPGQNGKGLEPAHVVEYDYPGQDEWISFPKPKRYYREMVFKFAKAKGGDRWTLDGSLTFAFNKGNFAGLDSPLNGQADPNITSTYDLPVLMRNTYGDLPNTPKYNFQMTATYDLGMGFTAGGRFIFRSGTSQSAIGPDLGAITTDGAGEYYMAQGQFLHDGNYGNSEALMEPRGSRGFGPDVSRFDLHFEWNKNLEMARKAKFKAFVDVYNVFNQQMALTFNQNKQFQAAVPGAPATAGGVVTGPVDGAIIGYIAVDNPRFMKPTSFQAPRSLQFGAGFSF